jgi:hypothetical protein
VLYVARTVQHNYDIRTYVIMEKNERQEAYSFYGTDGFVLLMIRRAGSPLGIQNAFMLHTKRQNSFTN